MPKEVTMLRREIAALKAENESLRKQIPAKKRPYTKRKATKRTTRKR